MKYLSLNIRTFFSLKKNLIKCFWGKLIHLLILVINQACFLVILNLLLIHQYFMKAISFIIIYLYLVLYNLDPLLQ